MRYQYGLAAQAHLQRFLRNPQLEFEGEGWGGQRDSNPQQQAPQAWTLPLSYSHQPSLKVVFCGANVKRGNHKGKLPEHVLPPDFLPPPDFSRQCMKINLQCPHCTASMRAL